MQTIGFLPAKGYDLNEIMSSKGDFSGLSKLYDSLHYQKLGQDGQLGDVFCFAFGAVVCWNLTQDDALQTLKELEAFMIFPIEHTEKDDFTFTRDKEFDIREDHISLPKIDPQNMLAISYGIAQSLKLSAYELSVSKRINATQPIAHTIAEKGEISMTRKAIFKKMGAILIERSEVNLHTEILDIPEIFWAMPELEPYYRKTVSYLDVEQRFHVLNRRLDVLNELFSLLSQELNHSHSSRLELIIIYLIIIEVILALVGLSHDVFKVW